MQGLGRRGICIVLKTQPPSDPSLWSRRLHPSSALFNYSFCVGHSKCVFYEQQIPLLALSLRGRGPVCFSHGVRVECVQGSGQRVTEVFRPPHRWWCVQGASAVPCFCSGQSSFDSELQKRQGLGPFCIFSPKFTLKVHAGSYFQSHTVSWYFVA